MKPSIEELILSKENQAKASKAVQDAIARADTAGLIPAFEPYISLALYLSQDELLALRRQELQGKNMTHWYEKLLSLRNMEYLTTQSEMTAASRRLMVQRVNDNQRLEGYVPDEQLAQLQEKFIAGELTTTQMIEILTDYAHQIQKGQELEKNLTPEQRKLFEAIDGATSEAAFEGATIDPNKVAAWKKHVLAGMGADELFQMIRDDKEKIIAVRPKPEYHDSPGMKHMGNGYFISGDDPEDPSVK